MARTKPAPACALAIAVLAAGGAGAQDVHKCVVNGQVSYQAGPCTGSGAADAVVPIRPGPTGQESRDAAAELARQRYQSATGRLLRPVRPMPAPAYGPPATPQPAQTTISRTPFAPMAAPAAVGSTTTTMTVRTSDASGSTYVQVRRTQTGRPATPDPLRDAAAATNAALASAQAAANTPRLSNCEELNRENGDVQDRLAELAAPGELGTRAQLRANAQAELEQVRARAQASQCRLRR